MKNLLLFLLFFTLTNSYAQNRVLKAGWSFSNLRIVDENKEKTEGINYLSGVEVGARLKLMDIERASLWAGFSIASKGYQSKSDVYFSGNMYKCNRTRFNIFYLELPILGQFNYEIADHSFYLTVGPYAAFGVYGRYKYDEMNTAKYVLDSDSKVISWGKTEKSYKRFDYGGYFGIGATTTNAQFEFAYLHGFTDVRNLDKYKYLNGSFRLTIGWVIND